MQFKTSVTPVAPVYTVGGAIGARYTQLGAETSPLGAPTGDEQPLASGRVQDFEHGRIYWSAATGAWETYGLIAQKYLDLGGPTSPLGWPTSGELGTPNGIGRFNRFTEGNIYFNPQAGTHCVYGAIIAEYGRHGYEGGRFGFPTTDEYATPEGRRNDFQGGWIAWISATGQVVTS
nr:MULTISPECIES: trehalose corynomycolyl transferase [unclassified Rhodococcus (in: high G+C Gram-positive bacteria)]